MKKNEKTYGKKSEKKVLLFPAPPEERVVTSMTMQVGKDRFVIHWEIEDLPPVVEPLILLEAPPRKGKRNL
jgi:hypothetical protein